MVTNTHKNIITFSFTVSTLELIPVQGLISREGKH